MRGDNKSLKEVVSCCILMYVFEKAISQISYIRMLIAGCALRLADSATGSHRSR